MTDNRAFLARSAAFASIAVAVVLVALKTWASWRTGSTAMLGSLADSALDLIASLATLAGVWIASQPADEDHRFGHGKAEALAAIFQVMLIALSAFGFIEIALAPRNVPLAVMSVLQVESTMRSASDSAEKPPNTIECTAPIRAQASIAIVNSGIICM